MVQNSSSKYGPKFNSRSPPRCMKSTCVNQGSGPPMFKNRRMTALVPLLLQSLPASPSPSPVRFFFSLPSMASRKNPRRARVGLVYDERMCRHSTPDKQQHPENPNRIRAIWRKLQSRRIPQRCVVLSAKEAEEKYIASVHSQKHTELIRKISLKEFNSRANQTAFENNSLYFNKGSSKAAYLAAGSVIEVSERVARGELSSAVAIVRPPGHHAEPDEAKGFCFLNNVAIAANFLINDRPELGIHKILIVDWDVHHGNGTQKMFWEDPRVLFFSVHRYDYGRFYPAGNAGSHKMVGEGFGAGYNINVPWERGRYGDADYIAVWDYILIPVARAFNPDIILISGGFDAAAGDPLGGCRVTPYGYSVMMKKLMQFAGGRIVMALEGGYNLTALANSVLACVETLLEGRPIVGSLKSKPYASTWRIIEVVCKKLSIFWPVLVKEFPKNIVINNNRPRLSKPLLKPNYNANDEEDAIVCSLSAVCDLDFSEASTTHFNEEKIDWHCFSLQESKT